MAIQLDLMFKFFYPIFKTLILNITSITLEDLQGNETFTLDIKNIFNWNLKQISFIFSCFFTPLKKDSLLKSRLIVNLDDEDEFKLNDISDNYIRTYLIISWEYFFKPFLGKVFNCSNNILINEKEFNKYLNEKTLFEIAFNKGVITNNIPSQENINKIHFTIFRSLFIEEWDSEGVFKKLFLEKFN